LFGFRKGKEKTMAVESRFVVIRNGVEVQTFMDKKAADEYDKMLDMADNLTELLGQSELNLDEQQLEDLTIFLAQQREDVLIALQAKKPKPEKSKAKVTKEQAAEDSETAATVAPAKPATKKSSVKKVEEPLSEAS
jgi:dsDNA-binding SOS-regulon protein